MKFSRKLLALCIVSLGAGGAHAATQTLSTTAFDISYDDAVVGLFGTPTLLGNSLFFAPGGSPGFSAQTDAGIRVANSTFSFTITANPGFTLDTFTLTEEGDYFFFGNSAGVAASGQLRVKPLDPRGPTHVERIATGSFVENAMLDFTTNNWTGVAAIDTGPITVGQVSIQNILAAHGGGDMAYAFIEKKNVELEIGVTAVPEPQAYALMLAGIGMVGFAARRRLQRGD